MSRKLKLFLDTNIFLEYINERSQFESVSLIMGAIDNGSFEAYSSVGSVYTFAFLIEKCLKSQNIHRPELTIQTRQILLDYVSEVEILCTPHDAVKEAISNERFTDIEDSLQYQCALHNQCDVLLTINVADFHGIDNHPVEILTPAEFIQKYNVK